VNVLLAGQKWFVGEVFSALQKAGVNVLAVSVPAGDQLADRARSAGVTVLEGDPLTARLMPDGIDLIVAAHSHDFIGEKTRLRARYGGIGYHPSLLPLHRGKDAIRWAVKMGDRVTGGTVYQLSNRVDGGEVLLQKHAFIRRDDTAKELWRRSLGPLGVALLAEVAGNYEARYWLRGEAQDESLATWEPSIGRPPLHRPDLALLPYISSGSGSGCE